MKYEARQVGTSTTPISQASGLPWVNVPQELAGANNDAKEYSPNVAGCTGCHLITEAEWLTIVQNVLTVPSNWSTGTIGSGYIYSGHNDSSPTNVITADTSDSNGYVNTGNTSGNQRRTLTLTNGEVIWDMAGNVWECTSGQTNGTTAQQPGVVGNSYTSWIQWNAVTTPGNLSPSPFPNYGTSAAIGWTSSNGIGMLLSSYAETGLPGFVRGGNLDDGSYAGVLALALYPSPSGMSSTIGFRVSR
jgi:hypothetical protein